MNLTDITQEATRKFLNLLDVAAWDELKNKAQSPFGGGGIRAARKKRLAEAKGRMQELFGGGGGKEATPGEVESDKTLDVLVKELLERR